MFSHVVLGSNDIERSRRFYDAILGALGGPAGIIDGKGRAFYRHNGASLLITPPIDGQPATHANGGTVGFAATGPEQVRAWHDAGVASGGSSIEDPPGIRQVAQAEMYLAYLRDPDGNKLCAMHMPGR